MAETLGSLCDKLTIVKLKQWHSNESAVLERLAKHEAALKSEIDEFVAAAISGAITLDKLGFGANKIYKREGNEIAPLTGDIGELFSKLAEINCKLWHEQEKVYDFKELSLSEKDKVVKSLAVLNLERNQCIDLIDSRLKSCLEKGRLDHV